jgi:hypothetical protein
VDGRQARAGRLIEQSDVDWRIWAPVKAGFGSLVEVESQWSVSDLYDALDVLRVQAEVEAIYSEPADSP